MLLLIKRLDFSFAATSNYYTNEKNKEKIIEKKLPQELLTVTIFCRLKITRYKSIIRSCYFFDR